MAEKPGDLQNKFAVSNDSSVVLPANVNFPVVAIGKIYVYENEPIPATDSDRLFGYDALEFAKLPVQMQEAVQQSFVTEQTKRYEEARRLLISTYEKNLETVQQSMTVEMEGDIDLIVEPELQMAQDSGTAKKVTAAIEKGKSAEAAVEEVYSKYVNDLRKNEFTARIAEQIEQQQVVLQHHLHPDKVLSSLRDAPEGSVIFCKSMPPAEIMSFINKDTGENRFAGLVCTEGSIKGHAAIIAKSLGIPFAVVKPENLPVVKNGYDCIIDGAGSGGVVLHPSAALMQEARLQQGRIAEIASQLAERGSASKDVQTLDGLEVSVCANFGTSLEVPAYRKANVQGIGLYRTEMAENMRSDSAPEIDEDQWLKIFTQNIRSASGASGIIIPMTVRTLDIAGDKAGRFAGKSPEEKADYEARVTKTQMGAFLRLNHDLAQSGSPGRIKVMIPMIASVEQMEKMQKQFDDRAAELGVPSFKLGCMGEVPALFHKLDRLDVAFMSIGSNDLIHGLLETDRYHASSSLHYDPTDVSVLRVLDRAVCFGEEKDIPISMCGDMVSEPRYLALVLGSGITNLSTGLNAAPITKEIVRRIDSQEARQLVQILKNTPGRTERERILDEYNATRLGLYKDGVLDINWRPDQRGAFDPNPPGGAPDSHPA